jgi:hypothetical protein
VQIGDHARPYAACPRLYCRALAIEVNRPLIYSAARAGIGGPAIKDAWASAASTPIELQHRPARHHCSVTLLKPSSSARPSSSRAITNLLGIPR